MRATFTIKDVKILAQRRVYQGYFQLDSLKLQYRLFNGGWSGPVLREVFERKDAVAVLLFDPQRDQLILIEQFRVGTLKKTNNPWIIEVVAGLIEAEESVEDAVRRETKEETGLVLHNLFPISSHWVNPGGSTERIYLFCAQIDSSLVQEGIHGLASEGEDIYLHTVPLQRAYDLVNAGKIDNATTIIALLWLQQNEKKLRKAWLTRVESL